MADAEDRIKKREERRKKRKDKEERKINGTNDKLIHDTPEVTLNGDPDVSRETEEGVVQKSEAALPDVVKVPSGFNDRPTSPKNGYKDIDAEESRLARQQRYDSSGYAAFEPESQIPGELVLPGDPPLEEPGPNDEWSQLSPQRSGEKPPVKQRPSPPDPGAKPSNVGDWSPRVRDSGEEWTPGGTVPRSRGVNKPPIRKKEDHAWIREIPKLPDEPVLKEPDWLDLVRKRRWRSTVKARFPDTERDRIQFERRTDTAKKGLRFNPRGDPKGIVGPAMEDELSMYLIQQRRRIESDSVFETTLRRPDEPPERCVSDSVYDYAGEFSFDQDPRNRELAAAKGILNLSRPPLKGSKKEVHKNLAMERSRQSTMQWRFSVDPHEEPIWSQLPRPEDMSVADRDDTLRDKYWVNKVKFQTGQFDPPPVKPKPRGRSLSTGDTDSTGGQGRASDTFRSEEALGPGSLSPVKEMRRKLAAGEFKTSTPIAKQPVELEAGYLSKLREVHQRLAEEAERMSAAEEKPSYISREELDSMNERKKNFSEELFTEKTASDAAKLPREKPKIQRRRSDMELHDLLASRKETADKNAVEKEGEVASTAAVVSQGFSKLNASQEIEAERERYEERQEMEKKRKEQEEAERAKREKERVEVEEQERKTRERKEQQEQQQREQKAKEEPTPKRTSELPPEFLIDLKDCEILEGNDLNLEVVVTGQPEPTVEWFLDERKLGRDKRHEISSAGTMYRLSIKKVQLDDEGIYECVATNSAGKAVCDCEVLVDD